MTDTTFELNAEALGKMVAEIGAETGPGSSGWNAASSDTQKVNAAVIAQLRANGGSLPAELAAATGPLLVLTAVGAKSGVQRSVPLGHFEVEGRLLVIGSMAGSTRNPPWYYNLVANPNVQVELNGDRFEAQANVLQGADRDQIFPQVCELNPAFGQIQQNVKRLIPVVELKRA